MSLLEESEFTPSPRTRGSNLVRKRLIAAKGLDRCVKANQVIVSRNREACSPDNPLRALVGDSLISIARNFGKNRHGRKRFATDPAVRSGQR